RGHQEQARRRRRLRRAQVTGQGRVAPPPAPREAARPCARTRRVRGRAFLAKTYRLRGVNAGTPESAIPACFRGFRAGLPADHLTPRAAAGRVGTPIRTGRRASDAPGPSKGRAGRRAGPAPASATEASRAPRTCGCPALPLRGAARIETTTRGLL